VLSLNGLTKRFGATEVLTNISLEVADGEFCILLGPSGCGKSTILRLIAGLEQPSAGEISLDGRRIDGLVPRQRDVAFVFQNYALYPHMSVFDNLAFSLRLRGLPANEIDEKVTEAARLLEIGELLRRRPRALSGGQRQRVALGRAIVREPKIFLFDEPLSNLDATLRTSMRVELARLHRRLKATIVYVTHDQAEALTLGEKIIVLDRGMIQQIGTALEIYQRPANTMVARFVGTPQMNFIDGTVDDNGAIFRSKDAQLDLAGLLQKNLARLAGQALTLGVRPEDLHVTSADRAPINGIVEFIDDLGSERFLHVKCGGTDLITRAGRDAGAQTGERMGLYIDGGRLHLFLDGKRFEP
jgi:ABC-type sugar transport system ATPase subunit